VEHKGRGELRFDDDLIVEIFHDTELQISEATKAPSEFIFVTLQQAFGTTRAELNKDANARIQLETEHAIIKSANNSDSDVDFVVCQAKPVTCMVTFSGEIEVEAQGEVVTVGPGEASYVFKDQPPAPAICADMAEAQEWVEKYKNGEEVPGLGKVVADWPQEPCMDEKEAALPSSEMMVNIAGGQYEIGDPEADEYHTLTEQISLDGFWIDQFEVTNTKYQMFLNETGHASPASWPGGFLPAGQENHPLKGATWDDAFAYCTWVNKRLPSESEWEVAARGPGPEPALYPWGSDPGAEEQVFDLPRTDTYEVGSVPFNRSPYDVYDMAGNVWEWVGVPYGPVQDGDYILRGGRHGLLKDMAYRQPAMSNDERFVPFAGFRCAADQVAGE
jgi:formylglycine-generating enzyme required for sulfatase activity